MYLEIAQKLRECAQTVPEFTIDALARFFAVPAKSFSQDGAALTFHQSENQSAIAYVLKGTIFFSDTRQIVRGYPRILPTSDYTPERFAASQERLLFRALRDGEVIVEKKEDGGKPYFATRDVYDGGNPLVAAGIENVRALGVEYGAQAKALIDKHYPKAYSLAEIGYTPVFEMLLPEVETVIPADAPDMALIDVVDPDFVFVDRLEKERIAEDYGLRVVELQGRLTGGSEAGDVYKRLRGLEHLATRDGIEGFVAKGRIENSDQVFVKIKPAAVREAHQVFTPSDLKAVWEAVQADFAPAYLADVDFAEEAMLDYLGTHGRNARWQVQDFLAERE
jgi:hypothetical protein